MYQRASSYVFHRVYTVTRIVGELIVDNITPAGGWCSPTHPNAASKNLAHIATKLVTGAPDVFEGVIDTEWESSTQRKKYAALPGQQKKSLSAFQKRRSMRGRSVFANGSAGPREEDLSDLSKIHDGCLRTMYLATGPSVRNHTRLLRM